jgi:lysophospholipase L1-like esterase
MRHLCLITTAILLLPLASVAQQGAEPPWLAPMREVHAGFTGDEGYVSQLGDSITYSMAFWSVMGWTYPDKFLKGDDGMSKVPPDTRWRDIIKGARDKGGKHGNYSGWRVGNVLGVLDDVLARNRPEVALIMIGTNDMDAGQKYRDGLDAIVRKCLAAHCIPILNTIPPRRGRMDTVRQINAVVAETARRHRVPMVDYFAEIMKRREGNTWDGTLMSKDGVHPSGGTSHDYSDANLAKSGYALRNWLNWLMYRQVYFRVLAPPGSAETAKRARTSVPPAPLPAPKVATALPAAAVKCPVTRDAWVSAHPKETDFNMGAASTIKLKVVQEFGLLDFDVAALKGKTIKRAWLFVKPVGGHKWGLNGGTDLRLISASTIGKQWVEGKSTRYAKDTAGRGCTFNESSFQTADWGWPGANVTDVVLGNGNSLRGEGELMLDGDRHRMPLDPRLVRAMVAGATHGVFLMDGSTDVFMNCRIGTREANMGAYLMVETGEPDVDPPAGIKRLEASPAPAWATVSHGALMLTLAVPRDAFAYRVDIDGAPVERWQIPFAAGTGAPQGFPIVDLPPGRNVTVRVTPVDSAGNAGPVATTRARTSPPVTVPRLPDTPFKPQPAGPPLFQGAKIWACPEIAKISPRDGTVMSEVARPPFRQANPVWSGSTRTIRLAAAKGEIISFQVVLEGAVQNVTIALSDLTGPGRIPRQGVRLWRNWYQAGAPIYAIPLRGAVSCPMADNKQQGQKAQAVTIDYHIPLDTPPGDYRGIVQLRLGDATLDLPLRVKVYNVTIPETIFFNVELNCYGGPGRAGSDQFKDSFRLAHYHRSTINRVPYSQNGSTHVDWIPKTDRRGEVTDWTTFDSNLGGLLDGSWFKDNPRAGVPVHVLYMPHFEGYPLDFRQHYKAPGVSMESGNRENATRHHVLAPPVQEALGPDYQAAFVRNVKAFRKHFQEKGWNRTMFEMYQNCKGTTWGYSLWTMDEPYKTADWAALNFWAGLWREGVDDPALRTPAWYRDHFHKGGVAAMGRTRPTMVYRGDVSRSQYQGSYCNGLMNVLYGGGDPRRLRRLRRMMPGIVYTYGSANAINRSDWESAAWCLRAYCNFQDGVLPWQSLGKEWSLWHGDKSGSGNALIIDTGEAGFGHAVAALRVHALRRGQQDCELLRLLQIKKGWSRDHIRLLVSQRVPIASKHQVSDAASAVRFKTLTSQGFLELKEGVLALLEE